MIFEYFLKYIEKTQFSLNPTRITGTLHEYLSTFMTESHSVLLRMRNISDKIVVKIIEHILRSIMFLRKSRRFKVMWKNVVELYSPQMKM